MNALCVSMTIIKARSFAGPLKFLIRRRYPVSFARGKKGERKSWKREFCSLPHYFFVPPFSKPSARSFVKRWSLARAYFVFSTSSNFLLRRRILSRSSRRETPGSSVLSSSVGYSPNDIARIEGAFLVLLQVKPPLYDIPIDCLFSRGMLTSKFSLGEAKTFNEPTK